MKRFLNNKFLFIVALFIFALFFNNSSSFAYGQEDYLLSSAYNVEWIDAYFDSNSDPAEGIKKLIDSHQDYFQFTSSELGDYWLCEKWYYTIDGVQTYAYAFYFGQESIMVRCNHSFSYSTFNNACERLTAQENRFEILFDDDGFYASSTLDSYASNATNYGKHIYTQVFYHDKELMNFDSCALFASNHDIYCDSNVVFQLPELEKVVLAPVIQREKTKGTLQVVLKEILEILPLIILVLVSFLGLRKALKILSTLLNRS